MKQGDTVSNSDLRETEGVEPGRSMHFEVGSGYSLVLLSAHTDGSQGNPVVGDDGLIFTGHDSPARAGEPEPKAVDQPMLNPDGGLSQNGLFFQAAKGALAGDRPYEPIRVYQKSERESWVYRGLFQLMDAWTEPATPEGGRRVFKFRLATDREHQPSP